MITIGDLAANNDAFGSITFNSVGAVNISEDDAMVLSGSSVAPSAVLVAEVGSITDDATADVTVTGNINLTANGAGGAITIGDNAANNDTFGSVTFNTVGAAAISEDDDMVITGANTGASASLTAETGTITDDATADITVTGNASFAANGAGGVITIGDTVANNDLFGSITFNSVGAVSISEDDAMVLSGVSSGASSALVAESGTITDDATADVTVTGNASFTANGAGGAITIGDNAANNDAFGSLTFNSVGAVSISEDDAMDISGANTAASAILVAESGSITDDAAADVNVTGNASFTANGAGGAITIGDNAANNDAFGSVTFNSVGAVNISEDDAMVLSGVSSGASSALVAESGTITDDATADITVTGNASFTANGAGGSITIGDVAANNDAFGSLTFNSVGAVIFREDDAMVLSGTSTAASAVLVAEVGSITDDATADMAVTGHINFNAMGAGGSITIGDAATNNDAFGSLTFNSAAGVSISEDDSMLLSGANTSVAATLIAESGSITDSAAAGINVTGNASFTANGAGGAITIGDSAGNNDRFGSLTFNSVGAVSISEDDAMLISGTNTAGSAALTAETATLSDNATADISVIGNASFAANGAGGSITIGQNLANNDAFGSLTFNSVGAVNISEDNAMAISSANTASTAVLVAETGAITDDATADITVGGAANLTANGAGGAITIGDAGGNDDFFGTLTYNSVGAVNISEDDAMLLTGANTSSNLSLTSAGSIRDQAGTSVVAAGSATLDAGGLIQLADAAGKSLTVNGQATFLTHGLGQVVLGTNPAFLPFDASFATTNPDSGGTVNFGSLRFDTSNAGDTIRQEVRIVEDSATVLVATSRASSLYLRTQGAIDDTHLAAIDLADPAGGTSNLFFDAVNQIDIGETAGISINGVGIFRSATSFIDVGVNSGTGLDSGQTLQFGALVVQAPMGDVRVALDNTVALRFDNFGNNVSLAGTNIVDEATATLLVQRDLNLNAVGNVRLGDLSSTVTLNHMVGVASSGELRTVATNATIELDTSANLGASNVSGVYHLIATNTANMHLVQTSGLFAANRAQLAASGSIQLFDANINEVAATAGGDSVLVSGFVTNSNLDSNLIPTNVAVLVQNHGTLTVTTVTDPQTGVMMSGITTVNGNVYVETLGVADNLNIQQPIAVGNANNNILVIAGGQLHLTSSLSRGNPATDGLVTKVAPDVLVENLPDQEQVTFDELTQFVRFSYGSTGELQFTVTVLWADEAFAGDAPDAYSVNTDPGIQLAHPTGVSTFTVEKQMQYDLDFLLMHPDLTSTITIFNDAQIQTFSNQGHTDLNSATATFEAFVNQNLAVLVSGLPDQTPLGFVPPETQHFTEITSPDVRIQEFDDVQAALGQQQEVEKLYSVWLDDPTGSRKEWAGELDEHQVENIIRSKPNTEYRPGTYQIFREKDSQPEVLDTFEKQPGDPDKPWDINPTSHGKQPQEQPDNSHKNEPEPGQDSDRDVSVWTQEWERWMATGNFPTQTVPGTDQPDHDQSPDLLPPDSNDLPMITVAVAPLPVEHDHPNEAHHSDQAASLPTSGVRVTSANGLLIGGALAIREIHRRFSGKRSAPITESAKSNPDPVGTNQNQSLFDKKARRRRRLFG